MPPECGTTSVAGRGGERDGVADHLVVSPGSEPWAHDQSFGAQPADELALAGARRCESPHRPLEDLAVGLGRSGQALLVLLLCAVALLVLGRARAALAVAPLDQPQAVASLELPAGLLGAGAIVVHAGGLAVLCDELHDEVDVIAAVLGQAVANRDPPLLAEAHLLDELVRDLRPRLIRQRVLVGV